MPFKVDRLPQDGLEQTSEFVVCSVCRIKKATIFFAKDVFCSHSCQADYDCLLEEDQNVNCQEGVDKIINQDKEDECLLEGQ